MIQDRSIVSRTIHDISRLLISTIINDFEWPFEVVVCLAINNMNIPQLFVVKLCCSYRNWDTLALELHSLSVISGISCLNFCYFYVSLTGVVNCVSYSFARNINCMCDTMSDLRCWNWCMLTWHVKPTGSVFVVLQGPNNIFPVNYIAVSAVKNIVVSWDSWVNLTVAVVVCKLDRCEWCRDVSSAGETLFVGCYWQRGAGSRVTFCHKWTLSASFKTPQ